MTKKLERFGKYLLLDHILDGGMNRIFRARYLGDTASKICAIKVVLPQYSSDPAFKTMFMDEIKVTFGLLHPNIVQTYDYGTHQKQLYVAMEYCDGKNLKEYLDKLIEKKFVFPVEICTYIITQVCQGLHYAHTLTDKLTGKKCNIIHRDISPHNIMLTYDGAVKVIDFGIAKADSNSEATQAGTIKGKLSYLAPEYLEGKDLDPRYDQFAVGITLWELLCSRKLFKAKNDIAVLKLIQECDVPRPSAINPKVPKELDEIVLKSLSKDREKRFENLDQMNRALIRFLYSKYPDFNSTDLGFFAKELFKEDINKDKEKLYSFGKVDIAPYIDDLKREQSGQKVGGPKAPQTKVDSSKKVSEASRKENKLFDFGFEKEEKSKTRTKTKSKPGDLRIKAMPRRSKTSITVVKKDLLDAKDNSFTETEVGPKGRVEKKEKGSGHLLKLASFLLIAGVGYFSYTKYFKHGTPDKTETKGRTVSSITKSSEAKNSDQKVGKYKLVLDNFDKFKQKVFVNNTKSSINILGEIEGVKKGKYTIRVEEKGKEHFIKSVSVSGGQEVVHVNIPQMKEMKFAYVITSGNCNEGELIFNLLGENRNEEVPIKSSNGIAFPVEQDLDGNAIETQVEVFFKPTGEDLERRVRLVFEREDALIDLCDYI